MVNANVNLHNSQQPIRVLTEEGFTEVISFWWQIWAGAKSWIVHVVLVTTHLFMYSTPTGCMRLLWWAQIFKAETQRRQLMNVNVRVISNMTCLFLQAVADEYDKVIWWNCTLTNNHVLSSGTVDTKSTFQDVFNRNSSLGGARNSYKSSLKSSDHALQDGFSQKN